MKQRIRCFVVTILVLLSVGMTAWASETKIETVKVEFSYSKEPKSGDSIGSVAAKAPDNQPFTVDYAEYTNEGEGWVVGDRPVVRVGLTAKGGYRFSYTSKSHFSLSGANATFKKAKIYDDGIQMELEVYLKRIGGILSDVQNVEWSDTVAVWDYLEGAKSYEVRLYRDEKIVQTVKTSDNSYNFVNNMDREGSYTFRVRAISSYNSRAGEWSDYSDDYYLEEEEAWYQNGRGTWQQDNRGRWFSYYGGGYPRSCWKLIDNAWYYFNGEGYMVTGWQRVDGEWYYLGANGVMMTNWQHVNNVWYYMDSSGVMQTGWLYVNGRRYYTNNSGAMLTGWQKIGGTWYYMEGSGAMLTGWQLINGAWYYMDREGAMYENRWTPDGFYVNSSGAWVR